MPSVADGHGVSICIAQGHGPLPAGRAGTLSRLWERRRKDKRRETRFGSVRLMVTQSIEGGCQDMIGGDGSLGSHHKSM